MKNSTIEWTHHTINLWWGCSKVHAGCDNCYAERLSNRFGDNIWGIDKPRKRSNSAFSDLCKFQKEAPKAGEVHRVFVGSMMDIFEKPMPLIDSKGNALDVNTGDLRDELFRKISCGEYPNLMFLLLTKRPSNINKYIPIEWRYEPPKNVMFGTSVSEQSTFDTLVKQLLQVKGRRFLSIEPQIGQITLNKIKGIDWIIQGGESGFGKRPFNIEWAKSMRDECKELQIPYFFKQIDKIQPIPEELEIREFYKTYIVNEY